MSFSLKCLPLTQRVVLALQSPIHYQKNKGDSNSSLTRKSSGSGNRSSSSHSRPSSDVGLDNRESGKSQLKMSTSNGGSSYFDSTVSFCQWALYILSVFSSECLLRLVLGLLYFFLAKSSSSQTSMALLDFSFLCEIKRLFQSNWNLKSLFICQVQNVKFFKTYFNYFEKSGQKSC